MSRFLLGRFEYVVTAGCIALLCYLAWDGIEGPRGLGFRDHLLAQQLKLNTELQISMDSRKVLERRVSQLRPEAVDADLAEEMARRELSVGRANEFVVQIAKP